MCDEKCLRFSNPFRLVTFLPFVVWIKTFLFVVFFLLFVFFNMTLLITIITKKRYKFCLKISYLSWDFLAVLSLFFFVLFRKAKIFSIINSCCERVLCCCYLLWLFVFVKSKNTSKLRTATEIMKCGLPLLIQYNPHISQFPSQ